MDFNAAMAALHVASLIEHIKEHAHEALEEAAKEFVQESKDELGTYQDAIGDVAEWAPLSPFTQDSREAQGYSRDEPLLRSGELRDSIDYEIDGQTATIGSTSEVAVYQELGTDKIPPRSFLAGGAYRKEEEVSEKIGEVIFGKLTKR